MSFIINPYRFEFNPLSLSPSLWLDASDSNTLYNAVTGGSLVAANGTVARWEDKSGNGRHATQATAVNRPVRKTSLVNGKDILLYDNTDKLTCSLNLVPNFSIFIAAQRDSSANSTTIAGNLQNSGFYDGILVGWFQTAGSNNCGAAGVSVGGIATNPTRINVGSNLFLVSIVLQPTTYTGWINGANASTSSVVYTNHDTSFTVGTGRSAGANGESFVGKLFEVLVFPTALNTSDRQAVETYLRNKWGTP